MYRWTEIALEGEGEKVLGALGDSVQEVIDIEPEQIEPTPRIRSKWRTEFIKGIGKHNEQFIIILDIDRIFSSDKLAVVQAASDVPADFETALGKEVQTPT